MENHAGELRLERGLIERSRLLIAPMMTECQTAFDHARPVLREQRCADHIGSPGPALAHANRRIAMLDQTLPSEEDRVTTASWFSRRAYVSCVSFEQHAKGS